MTIENNPEARSTDAQTQPSSQAPVTPKSSTEENVTKELAREFRWVELAQIGSDVILAIVGIVAVWVYIGQLKEMRKSTEAARIAADAATSAAITAAKQFETAQRPWLFADYALSGPLTLDKDGGHLSVIMTLKNVGPSPAVRTQVLIQMFPLLGPEHIKIKRKEMCKNAMEASSYPPNAELLPTYSPGQAFPQIKVLQMLPADMESVWKYLPSIAPEIIACIAYGPEFMNETYFTSYVLDARPNAPILKDAKSPVPVTLYFPSFGAVQTGRKQ